MSKTSDKELTGWFKHGDVITGVLVEMKLDIKATFTLGDESDSVDIPKINFILRLRNDQLWSDLSTLSDTLSDQIENHFNDHWPEAINETLQDNVSEKIAELLSPYILEARKNPDSFPETVQKKLPSIPLPKELYEAYGKLVQAQLNAPNFLLTKLEDIDNHEEHVKVHNEYVASNHISLHSGPYTVQQYLLSYRYIPNYHALPVWDNNGQQAKLHFHGGTHKTSTLYGGKICTPWCYFWTENQFVVAANTSYQNQWESFCYNYKLDHPELQDEIYDKYVSYYSKSITF